MKCPRCNTEVKDGELFCDNCGAKIEKEKLDNTKTLSRLNRQDLKDDDSDIFYQPGLEKKSHSVNIFLIIIILALIGVIAYLVYFNNEEQQEESTEEISYVNVLYNDFTVEIPSDVEPEYKDNKLFLTSSRINGVLYIVEEDYQDIVNNFAEITLKWNELGIKVDAYNTLDDSIYKIVGSSDLGYYVIYLLSVNNTTLAFEFNFTSLSVFDEVEDSILRIVRSTKVSTNSAVNNFIYPEYNLEPFGSQ